MLQSAMQLAWHHAIPQPCSRSLQRCLQGPVHGVSSKLASHGMLSMKMYSTGTTSSHKHADHTWSPPKGRSTGVFVYNSLTKRKDELIQRGDSQPLAWYQCGPTVYDDAHIGHACSYVRFDIVRRVLEDYFRLPVLFVQGLTDIDDKIIIRAQQRQQSWKDLAKHFETRFNEDMDSLNVRRANAIVGVSDHVDDIIAFIKGIEARGHAYSDKGSVWFDTRRFGRYGKLHPSRRVDASASTGELNSPDSSRSPEGLSVEEDGGQGGKHFQADFALWKARKSADEPSWESPWGPGRPGWHIECSAMASRVFGTTVDIHSGGIDLAFPHHENEEAQSESYHDTCQWVSYYMHSGHLQLDKEKMSKSLGNTISIRDMLIEHTADTFRMFCLQSRYRSNINFTQDHLHHAKALLERFTDFTSRIEAVSSASGQQVASSRLTVAGATLLKQITAARIDIDAALRDDFDTPSLLKVLSRLVSETYTFLDEANAASESVQPASAAASVVQSTLSTLGLQSVAIVGGADVCHSKDADSLSQGMKAALNMRHMVRKLALDVVRDKEASSTMKTMAKELLSAGDAFRTSCAEAGIEIQDRRDQPSTFHIKRYT